MADTDSTTNARASSTDFLHATAREFTEADLDGSLESEIFNVIEEVLDEARSGLVLVNSILGSLQTALDPEAVTVRPPVFFPDVLEHARQLVSANVRRLEYGEIRRRVHRRIRGPH